MSDVYVPEGWMLLQTAVDFVKEHTMDVDTRFVLDNWEYKYLNIRVDMRTGMATIQPANNIK
jgi:hypothetical protein